MSLGRRHRHRATQERCPQPRRRGGGCRAARRTEERLLIVLILLFPDGRLHACYRPLLLCNLSRSAAAIVSTVCRRYRFDAFTRPQTRLGLSIPWEVGRQLQRKTLLLW